MLRCNGGGLIRTEWASWPIRAHWAHREGGAGASTRRLGQRVNTRTIQRCCMRNQCEFGKLHNINLFKYTSTMELWSVEMAMTWDLLKVCDRLGLNLRKNVFQMMSFLFVIMGRKHMQIGKKTGWKKSPNSHTNKDLLCTSWDYKCDSKVLSTVYVFRKRSKIYRTHSTKKKK